MKRKEPKVIDSFTASNGITIEWAPDPEADRPFTAKELQEAKIIPRQEVVTPEFLAAWKEMRQVRGPGRPRKANPKVNATLRLDSRVLKAFRATGPGWQTRINAILHDWVSQHPTA